MQTLVLNPQKEYQLLSDTSRLQVDVSDNIFMASFLDGALVSNASTMKFAKYCYEIAISLGMKMNSMSSFYVGE